MFYSPSNPAAFTFFILFIVSACVEILFCILQLEKLRKIFKAFPMIFLSIMTIFAAPYEWMLYVGAICGLLGDIFLLSEKKGPFYTGVVFFFFGHIFYFLEILIKVAVPLNIPFWVYIILGCLYIIFLGLLYKKFLQKLHHHIFVFMGTLYFFSLFVNVVLSFITVGFGEIQMLYVAFGAMVFLFSDINVFKQRLVGKTKFGQVVIMPTYYLAQILIITGILLTLTR